jgi:hypothetical protein
MSLFSTLCNADYFFLLHERPCYFVFPSPERDTFTQYKSDTTQSFFFVNVTIFITDFKEYYWKFTTMFTLGLID